MLLARGYRKEDGHIVPLVVKVGQRVMFGKWNSTEIKIANEDFLLIKEADIFGHVD